MQEDDQIDDVRPQWKREEQAEDGRQRHANHREAQRRFRIAQRVERGGVEPAQRYREQAERGTDQDVPDVERVITVELA